MPTVLTKRDLNQPVSFTDLYGRHADSWMVPPNQSLLCRGRNIEHGKPSAPIYLACPSCFPERRRLGANERVRRFLTNISFHSF